MIGLPEARITLGQTTAYLALAPKSNASYLAIDAAPRACASAATLARPRPLRDASYRGAERARATGAGIATPTTIRRLRRRRSTCRRTSIGTRFYEPTDHGAEKVLRERLGELRRPRTGARGK